LILAAHLSNMYVKDLPKDIAVLNATLRLPYKDSTLANIADGKIQPPHYRKSPYLAN
jgi:hypothetical protein